MKSDPNQIAVCRMLRELGFDAELIPEGIGPAPDIRVRTLPDVLVEAKGRVGDTRLVEMLDGPAGTPYRGPASSLDGLLRKGSQQLRDYPDRKTSDYTVIWLIARWPHRPTILDGLLATGMLYGTELIETWTHSGAYREADCFFLGRSLFCEYRDLDGVVIQDAERSRLCLNPLSPRGAAFRESPFATRFREDLEIVDPALQESDGAALIAEPTVPYTLNDAVRSLKEKYGLDRVRITRFQLFNLPVG